MRIVAVADTHSYQDDLGALPNGDVFIHAGDLLQYGSLEELRRFTQWVRQLPHEHKVIIAGNHDWCFVRSAEVARREVEAVATYLQDAAATVAGLRFWGSPYQPEFFGWAFNLPRGEPLRERWSRIPEGVDVLITHGPPRGIGDFVQGEHVGCDDLLEAVRRKRPALHLFGHIHEDGGVRQEGPTTFANVTTAECQRGATVLDYEPTARTVRVVSVPG